LASPLHIHFLTRSKDITHAIAESPPSSRYVVSQTDSIPACLDWLQANHGQVDCLVLDAPLLAEDLWQGLSEQGLLLPTVVVLPGQQPTRPSLITTMADSPDIPKTLLSHYHKAIIGITADRPKQLETAIRQAIQAFLELPADSCIIPPPSPIIEWPSPSPLSAQQKRLTDKLKARLGYLGVYYKRHPDNFLRHMSQDDRHAFLKQLKADYRQIILIYFVNDPKLNQLIDDFVNQAFMVDISVSQIVEMHMELMDEFSKQLKLEGRSEEILLDYRLTLIDVIAHLCEMYRRSIPREQ